MSLKSSKRAHLHNIVLYMRSSLFLPFSSLSQFLLSLLPSSMFFISPTFLFPSLIMSLEFDVSSSFYGRKLVTRENEERKREREVIKFSSFFFLRHCNICSLGNERAKMSIKLVFRSCFSFFGICSIL